MYDKVADLKQEKVSPKRSYEEGGYAQMYMLGLVEAKKPVSVARYEVRLLNGVRQIRAEMMTVGAISGTTFSELYTTDLVRRVLLRHWNNVFNKIPKALLRYRYPRTTAAELTKDKPGIKAREALALVGMRLLADGKDERYLRNLIEELFTPSQYLRLKRKAESLLALSQLKTLMKVTDAITAMKSISIDDYC